MESISLHIEYLLMRHDCVILPGLGAFIATRSSAHIDMESGIVEAPKCFVSFNSSVVTDDGLLSHSLSRRAGLSFEEGRQMLQSAVDKISTTLREKGQYRIGRLGTLMLGEESRIVFAPSRNGGIFELPSYDRVPMTSSKAISESPVETKPEETEDRSHYYYFRVSKRLVKVAASIVLVATVCLTMMLSGDVAMRQNRASVVPVEEIIRNVTNAGETVSGGISDAKSAEKTSVEKQSSAQTKPSVEASAEKENRYFLIVATFRSEAEANDFISQHSASDYHLTVEKGSEKCWRVSAKGADSMPELRNVLNSATFKAEFKDCWIWEKK